MKEISIISASIRPDRKSHRVALYFEKYLEATNFSNTHMLDLQEFNFPLFDNTLADQKNPSANLLDFAETIKLSDGIIIVTPEYNGGYPASLKNVIDVLYQEWRHKPIAIVTVSSGPFGGSQALVALQFTLWKIMAWTIPAMFSVPNVSEQYDEQGIPADKQATDKLAYEFLDQLMWSMEADMEPTKNAVM